MRGALRLLRWLALGLAGVLLLALGAFVAYDLFEFQSRRDYIDVILADAQPSERDPPAPLKQLITISAGDHVPMDAARLLLFELQLPQAGDAGLSWPLTATLWWTLVKLHLTTDEQITIICARTFLGQRAYGYEAGARQYFEKPLSRLTEPELATLVAISRWPMRYSRPENENLLLQARDRLLHDTAIASGRR